MVCTHEELCKGIMDLCLEYVRIFSREMQPTAAKIIPMTLDVDKQKWLNGRHARPPRELSGAKQMAVYWKQHRLWRKLA